MSWDQVGLVALTSLLPVSELRGAIPLGIGLGIDFSIVFLTAVIFNILVFFPIYFGLKLFYESILSKIGVFRWWIERARRKGAPLVDKYGFWGIALFVAVPLPATGMWTGTAIAWIFGLDWKRSLFAGAVGVLIAGVIVSALTLGIISVNPSLYGVLAKPF